MDILNAIYDGLPSRALASIIATAILGSILGAVEVVHYAPYNAAARSLLGQCLTLANFVTLGRGICGLLIIEAARRNVAIAVFFWSAVGAVSDAIDGLLARWRSAETQLGEKLDQYIDWWFGFCVIGAVAYADGPIALNGWGTMAALLALYLGWRFFYPSLKTTFAAKAKTFMQFAGGPTILYGIAFESEAVHQIGYGIMWLSLFATLYVYLEYRHIAQNRAR